MYVTGTPTHRVSVASGNSEFDRWLEQVKREARAEALTEYADAIQHIDDVIQRQVEADDRWTDFQDAEREFNRIGGGVWREYYSATTHYARYRAAQIREGL